MPTGNLPADGKALWERVYDKALKGSCKGDKECAARTAWSAVKGAGWVKDSNGNWHKKSVATEFSLAISKASFDKAKQRMNFLAVGSDTDEDTYEDNMSMTLFADFIQRIQSVELPPERYRSKFWSGGMPYLSISHYSDLDGVAVPGVIEAVYIDGNRLKAKGYFLDTPLGRACFNSVCKDLYGTSPHPDGPIRISIAFLDYSHKHKSNGYVFTRSEEEPICVECIGELLDNSSTGKEFLLGHLIHLALTRVPVNQRTSLEVRSMTIKTRKDDALSIIGEDDEAKSLIDSIDKESKMVGKSELVIKSEAEEIPEETLVEESEHMMDEEDCPEGDEECMKKKDEAAKAEKKSEVEELKVVEPVDLSPVITEIQSLRSMIEVKQKEVHPLDELVGQLKSSYDDIISMSATADEKLRNLQEPFNAFSQAIVERVRSSVPVEKVEISGESQEISVEAVTEKVMSKIAPELAEIKAMLKGQVQTQQPSPEDINALVHRRSLLPSEVKPQEQAQRTVQNSTGVLQSILDLADKTTRPVR